MSVKISASPGHSREMSRLDQVLQDKNTELESARLMAEKVNLAKSEFLSSMSHELRSPLTVILGFAQLMESDSLSSTPQQKESIAQILQAGWHLLTLINEILDFVKVESRQMPLSNEPVSLAEVMLECQRMIEAQAQQRGIRMTFPRFDLPCFVSADEPKLSNEERNAAVLAQLQAPRGARLHTLLYVEDNPANLDLVEQLIARYPGIHLLTALNGKSGIEIARSSQPDVILMDINMPGISGIEAMKILRSDPATALIPVIALSANAMQSDIEKGLNEGFFSYITKPIKINEFMEALDVALEYAGNRSDKSS